eukprot:gnl/MRDRNA2_/MRDRNA2_124880_c0_seq1.p1 gnl/MRDRNA2_/MRDRNA2_124880_c0~~gnl/MRDRNA2_/MRDRNA2_124880_c0_seq1.p1  ORF type:complete len:425 (-),score=62.50 gnl/MRDRNA2_/MRDRNA2_124880_c0_seq1:341-1615(-)
MAKPKKEKKVKETSKHIRFPDVLLRFTVAVPVVGVILYFLLGKGQSIPSGFPVPPDVRPDGCSSQTPRDSELPKVSMIIPYLNEKKVHILGTLRSVLFYTPDDLLEEIIMISDGNKPEMVFREDLQSLSRKLRIIELPKRQGLIRAKMTGVDAAKAEVLVFMEPHCIVNRDWLQPLLLRIKHDSGTLAMPFLDYIPHYDFNQYVAGVGGHWRFEWNLNLIHTDPGQLIRGGSKADPWITPATSGGIFAIQRDFWVKLGLYDEGMHQWGGDHVEATMKVWRCGGRIEIVPCSRVGHLFRDPAQRPYNVDVDAVVRNYKRLAQVWFDDYLDTFYIVKPEARAMKVGNLTALHEQRKRLNCKSMDWYITNVDVEMQWEKSRVCIPGCDSVPDCCAGAAPAAPGHSTLPREIGTKDFQKLRKKANPYS